MFTVNVFSQNQTEPFCTITIHKQEIPNLLNYLFQRYGIEQSELIMINLQEYERIHNVKVLDNEAYINYVSRIDEQLDGLIDAEKLAELLHLKNKVVNIIAIEEDINNL
jgi:hypothetical protein